MCTTDEISFNICHTKITDNFDLKKNINNKNGLGNTVWYYKVQNYFQLMKRVRKVIFRDF